MDVLCPLKQQKQQQWNQPVIWPLMVLVLISIALAIPGYRGFKRRQTRTIDQSHVNQNNIKPSNINQSNH